MGRLLEAAGGCGSLLPLAEALMGGEGYTCCEAMRLVGHCAAARILRRLGHGVPAGLLSAAITSPRGGSSLRDPGVEARRGEEGGWRLWGVKVFATNGLDADAYVVYASAGGEPAVMLAARGEGVAAEPMGLAAYGCSGVARLVFQGAPAEAVAVGREARRAVVAGLGENRVLVAALAVGLARRALRLAAGWAVERGAAGYQAVAHRLARGHVLLEAAAALVRDRAARLDRGEELGLEETSAAKYFAVEAAVEAVRAARLTLGGYAYAAGGPGDEVRRLQLHVEALEPAEGTQDIQLEIVARALLGGYRATSSSRSSSSPSSGNSRTPSSSAST